MHTPTTRPRAVVLVDRGNWPALAASVLTGAPPSGPVHGVYDLGWLIGDESAISAVTQARLDTLLGIISSRPSVEPEVALPTTTSSEPTPPTEP